MQEVSGSIPLTSTTPIGSTAGVKQASNAGLCGAQFLSPSSRGLGHHPFTVSTRVRIPQGTPVLGSRASAAFVGHSWQRKGAVKLDEILKYLKGHGEKLDSEIA